MRSQGSARELERRRELAVARVNEGHSQAQVAAILGVHHNTVSRWVGTERPDARAAFLGSAPGQGLGHRRFERRPDLAASGLVLAGGPKKNYVAAETVVKFSRVLLKHLRGRVIVVWDGGSNHKGPLIRALCARHPRLHLERLSAYAPDLNPVEQVWSHLKYARLATQPNYKQNKPQANSLPSSENRVSSQPLSRFFHEEMTAFARPAAAIDQARILVSRL